MGKTIDFRTAQLDRDGRKYYKDDNGDIWFPYCFEYDFLGKTFGLELWARDLNEAQIACNSVRQSLRLMGEIIEEIPA